MLLALMGLAQAIGAAPPERIDLTIPQPCRPDSQGSGESGESGDIVVCAHRPDDVSPYRIAQPPAPQAQLPRAEVQLGEGVSVAAETESADVGGFPSNRALIRLKLKF